MFDNLIPKPCRVYPGRGALRYPRRLVLEFKGLDAEQARRIRQLCGIVLKDHLKSRSGRKVTCQFRLSPSFRAGPQKNLPTALAAEAYELVIGKKIVLVAVSLAGLQRGIQTLKQIMEDAGPSASLPCCRIIDWPRIAQRGLHLDLAREMEYRHGHLKRVVELCAYFKLNTLHLYLENKFRYASAPEIVPPGVMTPRQARALCDYARVFGIIVVPQVPTMGHMEHFLHGKYKRLREDPKRAFNLCPSHPGSRPFLAGLIADVAAAFRPPWIHVGYDESHAGVCPRCRKRGTPQEILADHLNWLNAQVQKHNARTMIYGDKFLAPRDFPRSDAVNGGTPQQARQALARVSRDVIITDWHYTAPRGGTVRYFVKNGFETQIVTSTNTFHYDFVPLARGQHWIAETIDNAIKEGATGMFNSNWESYHGQFFENQWFFQALAAERAWSRHAHDYSTFGRRFSSRFWGVETDYYSDLSSVAETTPVERRRLFLSADILSVLPERMKCDYESIGEYIIARCNQLRQDARRNRDTLRMLDMPGVIIRYMGQRAVNLAGLDLALASGNRKEAVESLRTMRRAARQVATRLSMGYRLYGGAVLDRKRIQVQMDALDTYIGVVKSLRREQLQGMMSAKLQKILYRLPTGK